MTQAGAVELPGEIAGVVALDELVIHGWDVARASGQIYDCDRQSLEVVHGFVAQFSGPGQEADAKGCSDRSSKSRKAHRSWIE